MAYPVDSDDIAVRWRALDADEAALAEVLLEDAAVLLDNQRPVLAAAYALKPGLFLPLIRMVLVRAVKRVLANPDAVRGQTIGADGTVSISYGLSTTSTQVIDGVYIDDADLVDLDRALAAEAGGTGRRRVRSVRLLAYDEPVNRMSILPLP